MLTIQDEKSKIQAATRLLEEMAELQAQLRYAQKMDKFLSIEGYIERDRYDIYIPRKEELNEGVTKALENLLAELATFYSERLASTEKQYAELFFPKEEKSEK